ncbi:helix-turn-helix domain-containing protein [Paenibacillus tarimensis]
MLTESFRHNAKHYYDYSFHKSYDPYYSHHAHFQMELLLIYKGKGRLILNQQISDFQSGMLVIIQPYQLHGVKVNSDCYERSRLHFEPHTFQEYIRPFPSLDRYYQFLWKGLLERQWIFWRGDYIPGLFHQLHIDLTTIGSESEKYEIMGSFLVALFQHLKTNYSQEALAEQYRKQRVYHHAEKVISWVENNYKHKFVLSDLAASLHLTPQHVSALFRHATGSSITDYIIARRIREACYLLSNTSENIDSIAFNIGYASSSHFCDVFKKHLCLTPLQYRNMVRQKPVRASNRLNVVKGGI